MAAIKGKVHRIYFISGDVADGEVAHEVAKLDERIRRGYVAPLRFYDSPRVDVHWFVKQPRWIQQLALRALRIARLRRAIDAALFWVRCRVLDMYWFFRDLIGRR